jgi:protease PrsW
VALILYVILVLLPILFWYLFFRKRDATEPEPKKLLFKLFFWGAFASLICVVLEYIAIKFLFPGYKNQNFELLAQGKEETISFALIASMVIAGVIEELVKFYFLKFFISFNINFNQIRDGVIYGIMLALGFAIAENSFYYLGFVQLHINSFNLAAFALVRSIGPLLLHIVTAGIVGLSLGIKKFSPGHRKTIILEGLGIAIIMHAAYNAAISFGGLGVMFSFAIIIAGLAYLLIRIAKPDARLVWRLVRKP